MSTRHTRFHTLNEDYKSFGNIIFSSNDDKPVKYIALYNETVSRRWNQSIKTRIAPKSTKLLPGSLNYQKSTQVYYGFMSVAESAAPVRTYRTKMALLVIFQTNYSTLMLPDFMIPKRGDGFAMKLNMRRSR